MPRKNKGIFSGGHSVARVKVESRVSRTQESLSDVMRRTAVQTSHRDPFLPGLYDNFGFLRTLFENMCTDRYIQDNDDYVIYDDYDDDYDEEDDEEEEDDDDYYGSYKPWSDSATPSPLPPHPNLRQLTQEEADKHAKELAEKEERRKEKLEKNKQKKMRQKERKRLEKEKENKDKLPEVEQNKPKFSGSCNENIVIKSKKKTMPANIAVPAATEDKSVDGDSTRSSDDPDEQIQGEDIRPEDISSFISLSNRWQFDSPVTEERKVGGTKKKKNNKTKTPPPAAAAAAAAASPSTTWGRRCGPERGESPVIPQTPPLPKDTSSDKKEIMNGTMDAYSQRTTELAAAGHHLASCGQYEMAVKYFTDAIKYNPKEYKLFGNRSFCYERLQQYEPALQDADLALSLEPSWIKGFFRRGKALCGLKMYYEASLTYTNILKQDSSSVEAAQELKRAQTLHLMEMGFSSDEAGEALKEHATLEEAVDALFSGGTEADRAGNINQHVEDEEEEDEEEEVEDEVEEEGEWTVLGRSRPHQRRRENAASPKPVTNPKRHLFSVWVGSLAPTLTIPALHTLFNRAGAVLSVKMLVDQQCAFINYTRREDCDLAIKLMDGLLVEGTPLAVRYPNRFLMEMKNPGGNPRPASRNLRECFFWRTSGCNKPESCIFKHVQEHKHIDRDKLRH